MISAAASAEPAGRASCCVTGACRGDLPSFVFLAPFRYIVRNIMTKDGFDVFSMAHRETARSALGYRLWLRSGRHDHGDDRWGDDGIGLSCRSRPTALSVADRGRAKPAAQSAPICLDAHRDGGGNCPCHPLSRRGGPHRGDRLHRAPTAENLSGGPRALAQALGELFSRLQATAVFPYYVNYGDIVARLFAHVRRTGLFAAGMLDAHAERLEVLREAYDAGASRLVSSHNDPTPNNILFDGKRLWLIDWEWACRNDPLVDAAIVLRQFARSRELEDVLLKAWFGCAPDEALRARLAPVRALTRLFYAGVMFSASAAASWAKDDTIFQPQLPSSSASRSTKAAHSADSRDPAHPRQGYWRHSCPVWLRELEGAV